MGRTAHRSAARTYPCGGRSLASPGIGAFSNETAQVTARARATLTDIDFRLERGVTLRRIVERLEDQGAVVVVNHGAVLLHVTLPGQVVNRLAPLVRAARAVIRQRGRRQGWGGRPGAAPDRELSAGGDVIESR